MADKLTVDLQGRVKLEDAGFDWKILGPDVDDFEYVAWGWGAIKTPPTERQLELDPHAGYDVLNHTAQLLQVLQQLKDPHVQAGLAAQPDILYQVGVCAREGARTC